MALKLNQDDCIALLKHYEVGVDEDHSSKGTAIRISGGPSRDAAQTVTVNVGEHSAHRICPVTDFLAEGMVLELEESQLKSRPQLRHAIAHLIVKLSRMYVKSELIAFTLDAVLEGDHYEVVRKSLSIEASHKTSIPRRLDPHAHDRNALHFPRSTS